MNRIITISYNEFSIDPNNCGALVNAACHHQTPMLVSGVAVEPDHLIIALESTMATPMEYNFAPVEAESQDDYLAEISARYYAGFSLICGFQVRDKRWALYGKPETVNH